MENNDLQNESRKRILQLRKENGMSMEEFGKKVGVAKSTVFRWESGDIDTMKNDQIKKIAEVFHVSPLWLIGVDVPKEPQTSKEKEIIRSISDKLLWLKKKDLEKLDKFIDEFLLKK